MKITFVLPTLVRIPMGGAKVVYAHAAGLASLGHDVTVVGPRREGTGLKARAMEAAVSLRNRAHGVADNPYYSARGVETLIVPEPTAAHFPEADVVVATGVQTARWVDALPKSRGEAFYFIQGYEDFAGGSVEETWRLPLTKFTCARWLRARIEQTGENVLGVVPNAIDPAEFFIVTPVEKRGPRLVAMYHRHPVKGPDVLIAALERIKSMLPAIGADIFSARPPSHSLPTWVDVHVRPSIEALRGLYNRAAVVWSTSRSEGWGLVPMEAAACGSAVVATETDGVREFLTNGESARLTPIGVPKALAEETCNLLADPKERIRVAGAAEKAIARFSWEESTAALEEIISN